MKTFRCPPALALWLLLAGLAAGSLSAQSAENPYEPLHRDPLSPRLIDMQTPFTLGARRVEVLFNHRFQQTVSAGSASNLWGLDGGADVGLGLGVGLTRHFDLTVFRSSFQENFELAGKFLVVEQAPRVPLSFAVRAGANLLERGGVTDSRRPFAQVLLGRSFGQGINLLLAPTWVRDTPRLRNAWNVPVGLTVGLPGGSFLAVEVVAKSRDLQDSVTAWHVALEKPVGSHLFALVLGNSRATTVDQTIGGDSAAGFKAGDVRLGFNLTRNFDF